ncbi:hypothetical protein IKN40_05640, partial [bacterium]|nr:hypothetical protein [bacterium]
VTFASFSFLSSSLFSFSTDFICGSSEINERDEEMNTENNEMLYSILFLIKNHLQNFGDGTAQEYLYNKHLLSFLRNCVETKSYVISNLASQCITIILKKTCVKEYDYFLYDFESDNLQYSVFPLFQRFLENNDSIVNDIIYVLVIYLYMAKSNRQHLEKMLQLFHESSIIESLKLILDDDNENITDKSREYITNIFHEIELFEGME